MKRALLLILYICTLYQGIAQTSDYSIWNTSRHEYTVGGITVSGTQYVDTALLITLSGLSKGDKLTIPGDEKIGKAIDKLWNNNLFSNIEIAINRIDGNFIFLDINATEIPRLSKKRFVGDVTKNQVNELNDVVGLTNGRALTQASLKNAELAIKDFYLDKGYNRTKVSFSTRPDSTKINHELLTIRVDKGTKVRIDNISIAAVENAYESTLKSKMKEVKERLRFSLKDNRTEFYYQDKVDNRSDYYTSAGFLSLTKTKEFLEPYINLNFFSSAKFDKRKIEAAENNLIDYYNSIGYRDAEILKDTFYYNSAGNINIEIMVNEGNKYYFGDFEWRGNTKYEDKFLERLLSINKGTVYSRSYLSDRIGLAGPGDGSDITSIYQDDGYLFFSINPVEKRIYNDTIDFEMRVTEGPQAIIKNINIFGNDKTNEHVIRREIRTLPGNKYSRADIIRSIRELSNLGYFNPENIIPQPKPNQKDGTVDIDYTVEEKSNDKMELSAGFGGQRLSIFGTFGLSFNNFSLKNIGKPKTWDPLPVGDGQKLNIRLQSNGGTFDTETISFTEPWLAGKKPTALTVMFNRSFISFTNPAYKESRSRDTSIVQYGGTVAISKRVKWPDDNFLFNTSINYTRYKLNQVYDENGSVFIRNFTDGDANNLNFGFGLSRYSIDNPLYPRSGSNIMMNLTLTPPYSLFNGKDYTDKPPSEIFKWVEYQKIKFTAEWYQKIKGNLVFKLAAKYGFMGYYNPEIGFSPFERFRVGGDGLSGLGGMAQNLLSRDIVAQRGYKGPYNSNYGSPIFNKYTFEFRVPVTLNPSSTIYALAFFEAANAWDSYQHYNPFQLNRSTGIGLRAYLPMFGLLGVDFGLGLDRYTPGDKLTQFANFTFMLGQEPQ